MKIETTTKTLATAVAQAALCIRNSASIPIMHHMKVTGHEGEKPTICATDLERWIDITLDATVTGNSVAAFTIGVKQLDSLVKGAKSPTVALTPSFDVHKFPPTVEGAEEIETRRNFKTVIEAGKFKYTILGLDDEEFPKTPTWEQKDVTSTFKMPVATLLRGLARTDGARSTDDTRPILTGTLLQVNEDGGVKFVATDTHRLYVQKETIECTTVEMFAQETKDEKGKVKMGSRPFSIDIILPAETSATIKKLLTKRTGDVQIRYSQNQGQIIVEIDEIKLTSRLIEGQFPNYERVIPSPDKHTDFDKADFIEALTGLAPIVRDNANRIVLDLDYTTAKLRGFSGCMGEAEADVKMAQPSSFPTQQAFNVDYMLGVLKTLSSSNATFRYGFSEPLRPILITDPMDDSFTSVVMPMQVL